MHYSGTLWRARWSQIHSHTSTQTRTHSHVHSALRLSSTPHSWSTNHFLTSTSGSVWLSTFLGLIDTHTLSHNYNLKWAEEGGSGRMHSSHFTGYFLYSLSHHHLHPPHSHLPTSPHTTQPLPHLTPPHPHLSQWHSVQFKLVVTSMSSTGDHGRSQRKDTLDPISTSLW